MNVSRLVGSQKIARIPHLLLIINQLLHVLNLSTRSKGEILLGFHQ